MPTKQIEKEWRENPEAFFYLRDVFQHCKGIRYAQAYTWVHRGVKISRARNAKPCKLEAVKIGGHWRTTKAAVERFTNFTMNGGS